MKRIISALLVCLLVLSLAACGGGAQSGNTANSGNSKNDSSIGDTAGDDGSYPVILSLIHIFPGAAI